jgi:hypothetical protein
MELRGPLTSQESANVLDGQCQNVCFVKYGILIIGMSPFTGFCDYGYVLSDRKNKSLPRDCRSGCVFSEFELKYRIECLSGIYFVLTFIDVAVIVMP